MPVAPSRRAWHDENGAVAIMVAALAVVLFVVGALVVDLGLARDVKRQSQNASDASALAAANALYPASGVCTLPTGVLPPCIYEAVDRAKSYAAANYGVQPGDWSSCPASPPGYVSAPLTPSCISFDSLVDPTKVWVAMPTRDVSTGFGALAGVDEIPVSSRAQARADEGLKVSCGLCFLGSIDTVKFKATVAPGGIAVNGSVTFSGNGATWTAPTIGYTGVFDPNDKITEVGTVTKVPAFTDPWATKAGVPPTIPTPVPSKAADANPCTSGPGVYGSYEFKNACTFATPGLYVVTGQWDWKNVTVTAPGVTIYATCGTRTAPAVCNGSAGGALDTKNGDLILTAPATGVLSGLGIVYDRKNTAPLELQGNGSSVITGSVYAPSSNWDYNGNSDLQVNGGPVILKSMTGNGTTGVRVVNAIPTEVVELPGEIGLAQ